jgi:phosphatidylinositol alpha-1,6-mannosyltransferase
MVGWVNRMAFNRMTKIIAVSDFTKSVVIRSGIRPRSIEVIRNGADAGRFVVLDEARKREFRPGCIPADARVLLTVGHVSERKGQEIVIRAMPEVLKVHPNVHYCMAGLPTLRGRLEGIARELGVFEHVHFLGAVSPEELVAWINRCDLFVMTSKTTANGDCEGFGIAVVEAALCGKAAVVSAQSGLIEAIVEGVTGESVEEGNSEATAGAINRLLGDNARLASMGGCSETTRGSGANLGFLHRTIRSCVGRIHSIQGWLKQAVCTDPIQYLHETSNRFTHPALSLCRWNCRVGGDGSGNRPIGDGV